MKRMMLGLAALVMILAPLAGVCGKAAVPEARADTQSDLETKVAALPKNDTENFYILNSLDDEVIAIPFRFKEPDFEYGDTGEMLPGYEYSFNLFYITSSDILRYDGVFAVSLEKFFFQTGGTPVLLQGYDLVAPPSLLPTSSIDEVTDSYSRERQRFEVNVRKEDYTVSNYFSNAQLVTISTYKAGDSGSIQMAGVSFPVGDQVYSGIGESFRIFCVRFGSSLVDTQYVYIDYELPEYLITYEYRDEAGLIVTESFMVKSGSLASATAPDLPDAPYCSFSHWSPLLGEVTMPTTYRAVYTDDRFIVIFHARDGTTYLSSVFTYYTPVSVDFLPDYSVTKGNIQRIYTQIGWSLIRDGTKDDLVDLSSLKVTESLNFYPVFELSKEVDLNAPVEEDPGENVFATFFNSLGSLLRGDLDEVNWIVLIGGMVILAVLGPIVIPLLVSLVQMIIRGIQQLVSGISRKVSQRRKK